MSNIMVISKISDDEIKHYGVMGMKWGVRKANYKTQALSKKVRATVRRFDRGKEPDTRRISRKVRSQKYRVDSTIKRAERFLSKNDKANAKEIINRYNRDPNKRAAVEDYIKSMKVNSVALSELRLELIDIRI